MRPHQHAAQANENLCKNCLEQENCFLRRDSVLRNACLLASVSLENPAIVVRAEISYYNHEGYADPTAYHAFMNIMREERRRACQASTGPRIQLPAGSHIKEERKQ